MDTRTMYDLIVVTNELEFEELSEKLENHLIQSKASWLRTHFTFIYLAIFKHSEFKNLENFLSILKLDDLQMNEKEIWDYVIKWGMAQNPTLPEKMEEWSDENIMTLKTFMWNDLKQHLILPDHQHNNIVIAKVEGTNEIIDGFNPLAWNKTKEGWVKTNKSFIFSFKDGNIQNPILSEVKNETYALRYPYYNKDDYGPTFGEYEFTMRSDVSDFTQDKKNRCYSYDRFSIIDYEVFKVVFLGLYNIQVYELYLIR
ncbi:hypothetical protein Glove_33g195 [Diversispora epigaea]|uniref:Uncharacterized protein n=1 Tax=Diversispora epigaea TaxID=1348612 RepID=A0A397JHN9_9GLOM|nr:hypothetical protein Glove_33g195 [Diversispora epigaea]